MFTIAVLNQKGGVGKTTTVANLGAALAARGCELCLVDLDPQSHLTLHFDVEPDVPRASIYDVLSGGASFVSARVGVGEHLSLVPSVIDLAAAEVELAATVGREQILRDALHAEPLAHDLVLIDCPPSLGLLTLNALAAADELLIPLQPHFLALQGLGKLLETVRLVQRRINPKLRVGGVVLCMYETGTRLAAEVVDDLRGFFDTAHGSDSPWGQARIYQTVIRRNVKLAECPSHGKTIFQYDASSRGAEDYSALADEFAACYPQFFPRRQRRPAPCPAEAHRTQAAPPEAAPPVAEPVAHDAPPAHDSQAIQEPTPPTAAVEAPPPAPVEPDAPPAHDSQPTQEPTPPTAAVEAHPPAPVEPDAPPAHDSQPTAQTSPADLTAAQPAVCCPASSESVLGRPWVPPSGPWAPVPATLSASHGPPRPGEPEGPPV